MVKQYPHTVIVRTLAADSVQDANGNWQDAAPAETTSDCRFETNSKNLFIKAQDGTQIVYDGIVYGQFGPAEPGAEVEVKDGDVTIAKGSVKQYSKGTFNNRIWL